jgi:hypothetical protein
MRRNYNGLLSYKHTDKEDLFIFDGSVGESPRLL